ncbi:S1C family serine protease [Clostridium cellulovorans]|uniref:HtrA2 peptidase n=1 Tax=Clostridium cellulovorans (strain ATCC 35296 / DSM 3052 / OCM 3 / 743B) TaxID=573061 RepID=D9SWT9_CLOC7|nr:trypsin-like peptidase domain-containing protein [Clostridium cellulovorans]ADL51300.1 HtrA2 peptidase [Clostridium cellulovorans 743B]
MYREDFSNDNLNENKDGIEKENSIVTTKYTEIKPSKTKKKQGIGKVMAGIAGVLVLSLISGGIGAAVTYNMSASSTKSQTTEANNLYQTLSSTSDKPLVVTEVVKNAENGVVAITAKVKSARTGVGEAAGSGFIFSEEGYILTNYHVIAGSNDIIIQFKDGNTANAKVINFDEELDLAVIKVTDDISMPAVLNLGNSSLVVTGESVVAIGSPLGSEFIGSVTSGIISSAQRQLETETGVHNFLQTNAAINPGNSGGPLLNMKGEVIGINSAKITGGVEGIGFAIPIDTAKEKIGDLLKPIVTLGIEPRDITEEMSKQYDLNVGVYIVRVSNGSAAQEAGLRNGDIIIKADGKKVKTSEALKAALDKHKSGDTMKLTIIRDGEETTVSVQL